MVYRFTFFNFHFTFYQMNYLKRRFITRFPIVIICLTVVSWAVLAGLVILTDPEIFANYQYFPVWPVMFLALATTLRLILGSWRRGLIFGLAGTIYMGFRYLGIGGWIYWVLLLGLAVTIEVYFQRTENRQRLNSSR